MATSTPLSACSRRTRTIVRLASSGPGWPRRRWLVAALLGLAAALGMGVPTGIIETSVYTRMIPVTWWDHPVWAASAALLGLTAVRLRSATARPLPVRA